MAGVHVPFLGRLFVREYIALLGSFVLIGLEIVIRLITLALPERVIRFFYNQSRGLFNLLSSPASQRSRAQKKKTVNPIAQAADFVDLCALFGYYAEEHIVQTQDGYLLGLHRLAWPRGEEDKRVNAGPGSLQKKVAYLHHGLMMNSEVWVCLSEKERCLPFQLVEKGYDVWLGNNRGNKYSKKSVHHSPNSTAFWDFSIDQFAFHDIPDTISYILETTGQGSLSYIGFSQGTAQAFATLSIHPTLNDKVDVFVALAPAMSPPGLANGIVSSMVKASPQVLYLAFGRRSILSSSTMWESLLYPPIFVRFIDLSLSFLFGWQTKNITPHQKLAAYPHLYSFASTKCVVHWFQIINGGVFQMFDDEVHGPMNASGGRRYYKVAKFPTRNIKTPVVLVYGGSDSLVDINIMLKELPKHTVAKEIPHYEHLDFLWASDVDKQVFPHVFDALEFHTSGKAKRLEAISDNYRHSLSTPVQPPSYWDGGLGKDTEQSAGNVSVPRGDKLTGQSGPTIGKSFGDASTALTKQEDLADGSRSDSSRPSSSDDPKPAMNHKSSNASLASAGSNATGDTRFGVKGIEVGMGKAANGVSSIDGAGRHAGTSNTGRGRTKATKS